MSRSVWPFVPAALLVACVGGQVVLVVASSGRPGLSVTPRYYEEALRWDERQAAERRVRELGWQVDVSLAAGRVVEVRLRDGAGQPLCGAAVRLRAVPLAAPDRARELALSERGPGVHGATAGLDGPGAWELQVEVTRGPERTLRTFSREVRS